MSFPSRPPRLLRRRTARGPSIDEVLLQLQRSCEALRRVNDRLQGVVAHQRSS